MANVSVDMDAAGAIGCGIILPLDVPSEPLAGDQPDGRVGHNTPKKVFCNNSDLAVFFYLWFSILATVKPFRQFPLQQ